MIKVTIVATNIKAINDLGRINNKIQKLPKQSYEEFVSNTPARSGNARSKTKLRGNEIQANYPYAKRLDEGYSRKAPRGMLKPTVEFLKKELDKIFRNI